MDKWQVQIVYMENGWEKVCCFNIPAYGYDGSFAWTDNYYENIMPISVAMGIKEIMVLAPGAKNWRVRDSRGRYTNRPTTEALLGV